MYSRAHFLHTFYILFCLPCFIFIVKINYESKIIGQPFCRLIQTKTTRKNRVQYSKKIWEDQVISEYVIISIEHYGHHLKCVDQR